MEDGKLHVTTSPAEKIQFNFGTRLVKAFRAKEGESLCEASVELDPFHVYVRVTVKDKRGRCANSNAYFLDEIL